MTDLATQIEQAGPEQQWAMLKLAWIRIHHGDGAADTPHNTEFLNTRECRRCDAFWSLLNISTDEAFTGAALMLVKDGWEWGIDKYHIHGSVIIQGHAIIHSGEPLRAISGPIKAATPALAIAAACVRAHDAKEDG